MTDAVPAYDWGIVAAVVIVVAVLIYRVVRREPFDRIVRLGMFIERQRYERPDGEPEEETKTEVKEWPRHDPPL